MRGQTQIQGDGKEGRILIVDDEWGIRDILSTVLAAEGYEVESAENGEEAVKLIEETSFDIVITDLNMPHMNGIEVLKRIQSRNSTTLGIVATGYGSLESAVEALKAGAFDYITKPFHLDEIKIIVQKAREFQTLRAENQTLRRQLYTSNKSDELIGNSESMASLRHIVRTVAGSDATALILGESGSGKELVARAIHQLSARCDKPWIPVNCAAIPEDLLESELFGHVRGAFTGATRDRAGRFQIADGGTIFLDEIGDMSLKLQVKILRVLEDRKINPVGSTQPVEVNVRIIAATHQDLEANIEQGRFRKDLFYRLNVIPIYIPALRDRSEDVPLLAAHFAERHSIQGKRPLIRFTEAAMNCLSRYDWPGNVRELDNLIERLSILRSGDELDEADLPEKFHPDTSMGFRRHSGGASFDVPPEGVDFYTMVDQYERALIAQALKRARGVKNRAAGLLNLKRTTLVEKMKKKGMPIQDHGNFS